MSIIPEMEYDFEMPTDNSAEEEMDDFLRDFDIIEDNPDLLNSNDDDFMFGCDDEDIILGQPTFVPKKRLIEGLTMEHGEFADRAFSDFQLGHFMLYNITFKNCTFDRIDCQSGKFAACKFVDCDIISFSGEGYEFRECEFTRCHWSGHKCLDDCFYFSNCKYTDCTEDYNEE